MGGPKPRPWKPGETIALWHTPAECFIGHAGEWAGGLLALAGVIVTIATTR